MFKPTPKQRGEIIRHLATLSERIEKEKDTKARKQLEHEHLIYYQELTYK